MPGITSLNLVKPLQRSLRHLKRHPVKTASAALALDQVSKFSVKALIPEQTKLCLNETSLCLFNITNHVGSFGRDIVSNSVLYSYFVITSISLTALFVKAKSKTVKLAMGLLLSGGAGNLIDRFMFSGVTDFIRVPLYPFVWNIADASITAACILLIHEGLSTSKALSSPADTKPSKLRIIANSFLANKWNTAGQTLLYALFISNSIGLALIPAIAPALSFSLIRDLRHCGRKLF